MVAGVGTVLASLKRATLVTTPGTFIEMEFSIIGSTLEFRADGNLIARAIDTNITSPGFVRIGTQSNTTIGVDVSVFDVFDVSLPGDPKSVLLDAVIRRSYGSDALLRKSDARDALVKNNPTENVIVKKSSSKTALVRKSAPYTVLR
jgi:hypothetical protein